MMQNLFVTGCGRSGTSMVAGLFAKTGRFMGENLRAPRESNPKGFFESAQVNGLNERILLPYLPQPFHKDGVEYGADAPRRTHTWLARLPPEREIVAGAREQEEIAALVSRMPFCYKDPRFAYTFPNWAASCSGDYRVICVFRRPAVVVESILQELRSQPYLHDFAVSIAQLFEHWQLVYQRLIDMSDRSRWMFVSYEQVLEGSCLARLEAISLSTIDNMFPETTLDRSKPSLRTPAKCLEIFERLKHLAAA